MASNSQFLDVFKQNLSPSTLFHFTNKEGLIGILKDNFKLKYCKETIHYKDGTINLGIPMVSFCDIKISELALHMQKYGYYGLGLNKEWAYRMHLNPVIYLNHKSDFSNSFLNGLFGIADFDDHNNLKEEVCNALRYIKHYEAPLIIKKKNINFPNYRYADEREWRFVPRMNSNQYYHDFLLPHEIEHKKRYNKDLIDLRLNFTANDILYLIINEDAEIAEIVEEIRKAKSKNYLPEEIDRLTTRIITYERIVKDF